MMEITAMNIMVTIMTVIVLVNFVSLAQGCPTFFQGGPLSELGHRWGQPFILPNYEYFLKISLLILFYCNWNKNNIVLYQLCPQCRPHQKHGDICRPCMDNPGLAWIGEFGQFSLPAVINVNSSCNESKKKNIINKLNEAPNGRSKAWLDSMVWPVRKQRHYYLDKEQKTRSLPGVRDYQKYTKCQDEIKSEKGIHTL